MELKQLFRKRINIIFGFLCLFPILSVVVSIPAIAAELINQFSSNKIPDLSFYLTFALPQFLYPIGTMLIFFAVPKILKMDSVRLSSSKKINKLDGFLAVFMFMGISVAFSYISQILIDILNAIGINIPSFDNLVPMPKGILQIILFFIVMAVLPAICEEFVYRGIIGNCLSPLSKKAAIIISAIAFGLMHANLQQSPFAFGIGLFLAYICIKTENFILPVVMHFVNNVIAGIFLIISPYISDEQYIFAENIFSVSSVIIGLVAAVIYIKRNSIKLAPSPIKTSEAMKACFQSVFFWLFTLIYLWLMFINTVLPMLIESLPL